MLSHKKNNGSHQIYLLDTMNNVLGILILVLILTQVVSLANIGDKVVKPKELDQLRATLAVDTQSTGLPLDQITVATSKQLDVDIAQLRAQIKIVQDQLAKLESDIAQTKIRLAALEERIKASQVQVASLPSKPDLEEDLARKQKMRDDLAAKLQALRKQLQALLEHSPKPGQMPDFGAGRPPTIEFKPDKYVVLILRNGRMGQYDPKALLAGCFKSALDNYQADVARRGAQASPNDLALYFDRIDCGDSSFRITTKPLRDGTGLALIFNPRYGPSWTDSSNLDAEKAWLTQKLAGMRPQTTVVAFNPWSDSFDNYLAMVTYVRSLGFKTTWQPYGEDEELRLEIGPGHGGGDGSVQIDQ